MTTTNLLAGLFASLALLGACDDESGDDFQLADPGNAAHISVSPGLACWVDDRSLECAGQIADNFEELPTGKIQRVSTASGILCAIEIDGTLRCLTRGGSDSVSAAEFPSDVSFRDVSATPSNTCAVRADGDIRCWGRHGDDFVREGDFRRVAALTDGVCALDDGGAARCWRSDGTVMDGAPAGTHRELDVDGVNFSRCALGVDREIDCGSLRSSGNSLPSPEGEYQQLNVGINAACSIDTDDRAHCWGDDAGAFEPPSGEFVHVAVARHEACGLRPGGDVSCWGPALGGQRGSPRELTMKVMGAGSDIDLETLRGDDELDLEDVDEEKIDDAFD